MSFIVDRPLTNMQIELLRLFDKQLSDAQLKEIRNLLAHYFAHKATSEMDRLWEENGWSNETMEEWLKGEEE